jgi:hypothetical protein
MSTDILTDTEEEGFRVVDLARESGLSVKLIGGLGVAAHKHFDLPKILKRDFGDIDLVIGRKNGGVLTSFLTELGYEGNKRFNALHGASRLLFYDRVNNRQVDVFVSEFKMCHELSLENYLNLHPRSLAPEHLLLTKLQIVEINRKDLLDVLRIIYMHPNAQGDSECSGISIERVNSILSIDWGWYTTVTDNLKKALEFSKGTLEANIHLAVEETLQMLLERIESAPKGPKWKARAIVGRRKAWYEIPEEVNGAR